MLYDPADHFKPEETAEEFKQNSKLYERFMKIKQSKLLRIFRKKEVGNGGGSGIKQKSFFHDLFSF
jgi:CRISPR/Cas system CSM-associated protein Csm5 (group 7 of RAMP superfamily)